LFDCALEMIETVPLHIGNLSKAERGYMLYAPEQRNPVKAARLTLSNDLTVEQAFKAIAANCLAHIQHNEAGVVEGADPESIHQMRVGMRRLRSALGLFKDVIACPDTIKEELRWFAAKLGEARDWEVLAGMTLLKVHAAAPKRADMQQLQQAARDIARKNREEASAAINSVRYTRLMLSFSGWMQETRQRDSITGSAGNNLNLPIRKFAKRSLANARKRLRKREKRLHGNDAQARHQVRIAAKKTRYATEFFQSLYPARQVRNYVDALSALQDDLGWLNDAVVADGLLHRLQEEQPDFAGSAGFARGYLAARIESDIPHLEKRWKQFMKAKLFYQ
jgi:CHAD domain-containing protein